MGPKDATHMQYETAQTLGEHLAHLGLTILCGGRSGVMEAACKGAFMAGGTSIGMLPGDEWTEANPYVTIPIVTNMGPTRNSLIAKTAFALVAIGGGYGTLTEIAYGLHYDKPVFATLDAPAVAGCTYIDDLDLIVTQVIGRLLGTTKL
ncbi:TIGR00725 family protein [Vibrio sp. PP-XX7]